MLINCVTCALCFLSENLLLGTTRFGPPKCRACYTYLCNSSYAMDGVSKPHSMTAAADMKSVSKNMGLLSIPEFKKFFGHVFPACLWQCSIGIHNIGKMKQQLMLLDDTANAATKLLLHK